MSSRENILTAISRSIEEARNSPYRNGEIDKPPLPYSRPLLQQDLIDELLARMAAVQMSVERLDEFDEVPAAVGRYLAGQNADILDVELDISPQLRDLSWPDNKQISIGAARPQTRFAVTACLAAVAETGSILMASSADHPVTLTFLPDYHIVVVRESQVVAYLEDAWALVRNTGVVPRAVNLNTGPSRTGDIEQAIEVGAHGPRAMHVLLVS
ncbi:MAG: LUD domain-containing protein [Gammaproteobacteria bacterium]|nr:LUD domain-containing protein [Gammaproteobacteria bacterium]